MSFVYIFSSVSVILRLVDVKAETFSKNASKKPKTEAITARPLPVIKIEIRVQ
jgi:hypothetical protein